MTPSILDPVLPRWWDDAIAASWQRSRAAALSDWHVRYGEAVASLDASIVEHALAFGHGARSAYPKSTTWSSVAGPLRADWTHLGYVGTAAWDHVAGIVEHEWLRAAGPDGDAPPAS